VLSLLNTLVSKRFTRSTRTRAYVPAPFCHEFLLIAISPVQLVVVGFPSNQFLGNEPLDDAGIAEFCTLNHGVTFPLAKKSEVNGDNTNEVFKYLKNEKAGLLGLSRIKVCWSWLPCQSQYSSSRIFIVEL